MPVSCYLCGRDFGSRSIAIHVPNCAKKWEDEQRKVPKSLRRSPPRAPDNLDRVMEGKLEGEELRQFNIDAVKMWNEAVLVTCQHCKRTFFPEKLPKHQKACTKDNPMGNPNSGKGAASRAEDLMNYHKNKKQKRKPENLKEEHFEKENTFCKLPDIVQNKEEEVFDDSKHPIMQDFIDVLEQSEILQDKDLSAQLLFLINYFIQMKMNSSQE